MAFNKHHIEQKKFKIYVEEEVYKTSVTKEINYRLSSGQSSERNPLSTLSDNANVPMRSKTTYNKRVDIQKKKFRTKSTDGVVMKLDYEYDEKIGIVTTVETKNVCQENATAAVVKEDPPVRISPSTKPSKKIAFARKLNKRYIGTQELLSNCLYEVEYFKDNFNYMVGIESKYVFPKKNLEELVNHKYRAVTVNWLIQVQQFLNLSEISLFTSIRMMDYFLIKVKTPTDHYCLVGIICMWISSKIHDVYFVQASKLSYLCNEKYSKRDMIEMEKRILKTFHFNVNFLEPTTFLFYYMNSSSLEKDGKVLFGALFMLEIFLFLKDFSSFAPSLLAAAALYLTLQRFSMCCCGELLQSLFCNVGTLKKFTRYMDKCVKEVLNDKDIATESVKKYSVQARLSVAQYFTTD